VAGGRHAGVRDFMPDRWSTRATGRDRRIGFDILHCPGHSPGSVVFFNKEMRFAMSATLSTARVGRTDLPGGKSQTLIKSIIEKLLPLGDDVRLHLRPRRRLEHRPGADDQSIHHGRAIGVAALTPPPWALGRSSRDRRSPSRGSTHDGTKLLPFLVSDIDLAERRRNPAVDQATFSSAQLAG